MTALVAVERGHGKVRFDSWCRGKWLFDNTVNLNATTSRKLVEKGVSIRRLCPGLRITVLTEGLPVQIDGVYASPRTRPWR